MGRQLRIGVAGAGDFAIALAEAVRAESHELVAASGSCPRSRAWFEGSGLPSVSGHHGLDVLLAVDRQDAMSHLADATVVLVFRDAPLPRFGGANGQTWAILAGTTSYGVAWQRLGRQGQDDGIVLRRDFPIAADDTALTLLRKCFEAGLDSLPELFDALAEGRLQALPAAGEAPTHFPRAKRPTANGILDLTATAEQVCATVRALSYAPAENPLTTPKVLVREGCVLEVGQASPVEASSAPAGTVLRAGPDAFVVATADGAVELSGLREVDGRPLDSTLPERRDAVPPLPSAEAAAIDSHVQRVLPQEQHWREVLTEVAALDAPFATLPSNVSDYLTLEFPLEGDDPAEAFRQFAGLYAAFLAGVFDTPALAVSWRHDGLEAFRGSVLFADCVPYLLRADRAEPPAAIAAAAARDFAAARRRLTYARDLYSRVPGLRAAPSAPAILIDESRANRPRRELRALFSGIPTEEEAQAFIDALKQGAGHDEAPVILRLGGNVAILRVDRNAVDATTFERLTTRFQDFLLRSEAMPETPLGVLLQSPEERARVLFAWNQTEAFVPPTTVHALFEESASCDPEKVALVAGSESVTYAVLDARANQLAHHLITRGLGPEGLAGIALDRTPDLVVAVLAVLKAGGAYLPLDPAYPADRLRFMLEDSRARFVLTTSALRDRFEAAGAATICLDIERDAFDALPADSPDVRIDPSQLAYVIYTSGSTGKPKGVMIEHRNVVNFFVGMTERLGDDPDRTWLAVTSLSFDISVLELLWTLSTGLKVVLFSGDLAQLDAAPASAPAGQLNFSLFYFAANETGGSGSTYDLLLEGARFADEHGFEAVWTPERHFHPFGGLYPNPAVTGAALAAVTKRVAIRAGSCVLPLHPTARVAEDWAVIDNLSNGRAGIAFAAGWQPNDFVLNPNAYAGSKARLESDVNEVRRLWRGEVVEMTGAGGQKVTVTTLPRPVQPDLPTWITAAGNIETFRLAGRMGANLLTHLLGQSFEELEAKLAAYRHAWQAAGHAGAQGRVTLMLHTFVAETDDEAESLVRGPLKAYLRSSADLLRNVAWSFPVFQGRAVADSGDILAGLSEEEVDGLLEHAFERYFETGSLIGSVERCRDVASRALALGVNEIACLVDFGVDQAGVLAALPRLDLVRQAFEATGAPEDAQDVASLMRRHQVTHLQCTPSLLGLLLEEPRIRDAIAGLEAICIGGEAFPVPLANELRGLMTGRVLNMYGPTETTVWSSVHELTAGDTTIPIGTPIANTQLYVLDAALEPLPPGEIGDLWIGGMGVARGYFERPELTAERFIANPFRSGERMYRTGDLARWRNDGVLEFCGRADHQVKVRGHRIELGEIEEAIRAHPAVAEGVVNAISDDSGVTQLVAYVVPRNGAVDTDALRASLKERLPGVMVPARFVTLERLPLTPNGKADRKALPSPGAAPSAPAPAASAPVDEGLERCIGEVWAATLGVSAIARDANLFDSGGNSLLAVRLHRRLREDLGLDLKLTDVFKFPTIAQLAAHISAGDGGVAVSAPRPASRAEMRRSALGRRARV